MQKEKRSNSLTVELYERFEGAYIFHTAEGFVRVPEEAIELLKRRKRISPDDVKRVLRVRKDYRANKISKMKELVILEFKTPKEVVLPNYKKSQVRHKINRKKEMMFFPKKKQVEVRKE